MKPQNIIEIAQPRRTDHYELERTPDGKLAVFRWTNTDRRTLGKKLDEIIAKWREDVKKGTRRNG